MADTVGDFILKPLPPHISFEQARNYKHHMPGQGEDGDED